MEMINSMKEEWIEWTTTIPEGKYELISLCQDWDGLKLVFDDEIYKVEVIYTEGFLTVRSCDEGDRWKTIDAVLAEKGGKFFKNKLFFKVYNSEYKKWYTEESFSVRKDQEFEHHAYVTANDIVDVLALCDPKVEVTKMQS